MQNFGRGMWRRVGDYERLQSPQLLQQERMKQYLAYLEYQKARTRTDVIKQHREQTLKNINMNKLDIKENTESEPESNSKSEPESESEPSIQIIAVETDIPDIDNTETEKNCLEQTILTPPNIIPKKSRKKKTK